MDMRLAGRWEDRNTKMKMFDIQMYLKDLRGGRWYDEEDQELQCEAVSSPSRSFSAK